jgi:hypothetical protein
LDKATVSPMLYLASTRTLPPFHYALAAEQNSDDRLPILLASDAALWLEWQQIPGITVSTYSSYGFKCSSLSTICCTQARKQQVSWWHSVLCGQAYRRIAASGHRPASAPKSPATLLLQWKTSCCLQPIFFHVHIDLIRPLPTSACCLTAIDPFTWWSDAIPIPDIPLTAAPTKSYQGNRKRCNFLCATSQSPCQSTGSCRPTYSMRPTPGTQSATLRPKQRQPQHHRTLHLQLHELRVPFATSASLRASSPKQQSLGGEGGFHVTWQPPTCLNMVVRKFCIVPIYSKDLSS